MHILFINSGGKCDIFFLLNLIIIVIKKIVQLMGSTGSNTTHVQPMSSTQLNPCGLGWTYVMSWVGLNFFLTIMVGWFKNSLQSDPCTPLIYTTF